MTKTLLSHWPSISWVANPTYTPIFNVQSAHYAGLTLAGLTSGRRLKFSEGPAGVTIRTDWVSQQAAEDWQQYLLSTIVGTPLPTPVFTIIDYHVDTPGTVFPVPPV